MLQSILQTSILKDVHIHSDSFNFVVGRMQKGDEHCVALPSQVSAFGIDQIWENHSYVVFASYVFMDSLSLN